MCTPARFERAALAGLTTKESIDPWQGQAYPRVDVEGQVLGTPVGCPRRNLPVSNPGAGSA